jgi:hypothetical protein
MLTHQAALPFFLSRIATYRDPDGFYCFSIKDAVLRAEEKKADGRLTEWTFY